MTDKMLSEFDIVILDNMERAPGVCWAVGYNDSIAWVSAEPLLPEWVDKANARKSAQSVVRVVIWPRALPHPPGIFRVGDRPDAVEPTDGVPSIESLTMLTEALLTFRFWPEHVDAMERWRREQGLPTWPQFT